ncbi:MAG: hypothetical protein ACR2KN_02955 [Geodermatophilaceae bacterium]
MNQVSYTPHCWKDETMQKKSRLAVGGALATVLAAVGFSTAAASPQAPTPASTSTTVDVEQTGPDTDNVNDQQGDQTEQTGPDTDNVNDQQGDQTGPDTP